MSGNMVKFIIIALLLFSATLFTTNLIAVSSPTVTAISNTVYGLTNTILELIANTDTTTTFGYYKAESSISIMATPGLTNATTKTIPKSSDIKTSTHLKVITNISAFNLKATPLSSVIAIPNQFHKFTNITQKAITNMKDINTSGHLKDKVTLTTPIIMVPNPSPTISQVDTIRRQNYTIYIKLKRITYSTSYHYMTIDGSQSTLKTSIFPSIATAKFI